MRQRALRLTPGQRWGIRVAGIVLTMVGVLFVVMAFSQILQGGPSPGDEDFMDRARQQAGTMLAYFGIGTVALFFGIALLQLGFLRPYSQIVATETEGAVETVGGALGRGWKSANDPATATETIRVRCRGCGSLEQETAKFCSACGKGL